MVLYVAINVRTKEPPETTHGVGLSEAKRKHFDRLKSHKKCWLIVMLMSVVNFFFDEAQQSLVVGR